MTDRKKLIMLLGADTCGYDCEVCKHRDNEDACIRYLKESMADHLLANGVTVQKWIPVTERLPEMKADVLMYFAPDKNMAAGFMCDVDEDKTMWCAYTDGGFYTDCDFEPTHWMPLPEPPEDGGAENGGQ